MMSGVSASKRLKQSTLTFVVKPARRKRIGGVGSDAAGGGGGGGKPEGSTSDTSVIEEPEPLLIGAKKRKAGAAVAGDGDEDGRPAGPTPPLASVFTARHKKSGVAARPRDGGTPPFATGRKEGGKISTLPPPSFPTPTANALDSAGVEMAAQPPQSMGSPGTSRGVCSKCNEAVYSTQPRFRRDKATGA